MTSPRSSNSKLNTFQRASTKQEVLFIETKKSTLKTKFFSEEENVKHVYANKTVPKILRIPMYWQSEPTFQETYQLKNSDFHFNTRTPLFTFPRHISSEKSSNLHLGKMFCLHNENKINFNLKNEAFRALSAKIFKNQCKSAKLF